MSMSLPLHLGFGEGNFSGYFECLISFCSRICCRGLLGLVRKVEVCMVDVESGRAGCWPGMEPATSWGDESFDLWWCSIWCGEVVRSKGSRPLRVFSPVRKSGRLKLVGGEVCAI